MSETKDIQSELNDILAGFAKGSIGNNNSGSDGLPVESTGAAPTGDAATKTEDVVVDSPTAVEPTSTEAAKTEEPTKTEEPVAEPAIWSDWDKTPEPTPAIKPTDAAPPTLVFTDLGKAIGVDVKTQEDLVKAVEGLKAEAAKSKAYDNLPAELKKAVELASKGADYLEYLKVNTLDYS